MGITLVLQKPFISLIEEKEAEELFEEEDNDYNLNYFDIEDIY